MVRSTFVRDILVVLCFILKVNAQYGILSIDHDGDLTNLCARYVIPGRPLATTWEDAELIPFTDLSGFSGCKEISELDNVRGSIVAVNRFNCSVFMKAYIVQHHGAYGIAVITPTLDTNLPTAEKLQQYNITIPFLVLSEESIGEIQLSNFRQNLVNTNILVKPFIPADKFYFDFSFLFMWLIAVSTVTLGAFWTEESRNKVATYKCLTWREEMSEQNASEMVPLANTTDDPDEEVELFWNTAAFRHESVMRRKNAPTMETGLMSTSATITAITTTEDGYGDLDNRDASTESLDIAVVDIDSRLTDDGDVNVHQPSESQSPNMTNSDSPIKLSSKFVQYLNRSLPYIIFMVTLTGQVLLMYYFFDYMVYYAIFWFCLSSALGFYWCFSPFINHFSCGFLSVKLFCNLNVFQVAWLSFCIFLPALWCAFRHGRYAWLLQDFLGMSACVAFIGWKRIATLKYTTIVLTFFFFYDVFLVFITPLFTSDGVSVMEKMVIGGSDVKYHIQKEEAPSVFKIPFVSKNPLVYCASKGYYILGFGDVIIPGLLFGCCHDFAAKVRARNVYMPVVIAGYGCGLILTGIAVYVSMEPQPALFYLVPCSLIVVMITSALRKEFKYFWTGNVKDDSNFRYKNVVKEWPQTSET